MTLLLEDADNIIHGDRAESYGSFADNAKDIAAMFTAILGVEVDPKQIPMLMIAVKLARLSKNYDHRDSWVDIAGYAGLADSMLPKQEVIF